MFIRDWAVDGIMRRMPEAVLIIEMEFVPIKNETYAEIYRKNHVIQGKSGDIQLGGSAIM